MVAHPTKELHLIPVMARLIRPVRRYTDILGLFLRQLRELRADFLQVQTGNFFIEMFRQYVNFFLVLFRMIEEFNLCNGLVAERGGHDKTGVTGGATQVY